MKEQFHGHFKPSQDEFKKLWDESIFAFDANILLNLYRYSETTRNELLKVITLLNDRVWLPYQATEEYFRNRISTTGGQAKEYDKVQTTLNELLSNLGNEKDTLLLRTNFSKNLKAFLKKLRPSLKQIKRHLMTEFILMRYRIS